MEDIKFMIHACKARMWYVNDFMIPQMTEQGIPRESIRVWLDDTGKGNLISCMDSFLECGKSNGHTWHLQDDILLCRDFVERIRGHPEGVVCGFYYIGFEDFEPQAGRVPAVFMWNSFPCIRIPDRIAGECAEWFYNDARYRDEYQDWVKSGKHDDGFWHDFYIEQHKEDWVFNMKPNLAEHVDYLIGGSVVNKWRGHMCRSSSWEDEELINELKDKLARY